MTFSKVVTGTSGNGGQYSSRATPVNMFVVHHAATTSLSGVLDMMSSGSREVSANYVVKDDQIVGVVPEEYRSWSLSSSLYDSKAITVETCNSATGDASGWPISEASYMTLARLIADCAARYGFPIDRDHVVGHREVYSRFGASYPTACPAGIDLDKLVNLARNAGTITTLTEEEMALGKIVRIAGHGTRCYLLHSSGILECATQDQLDVAFTVTGQSRTSIPTISLGQFNAWGNHTSWDTPAGVFKVLDRHEATLKAIAKKLGA